MAGPQTRAAATAKAATEQDSAVPVDDEDLIAQVAAARRAGEDDRAGVEELLRRAAHRNQAALDRLAR